MVRVALNLNSRKFKKAKILYFYFLCFGAVTFLVEEPAAFSKPAQTLEEDPKSTIRKAQDFLKEGDKKRALEILLADIKKHKKETQQFKDLARIYDQMSSYFMTEKGQQVYELGKAMILVNPTAAIEKLKSAQELEPENALIRRDLVRAHLRSLDSGRAEGLIKESESLVPNPHLDLMKAHIVVANQTPEKFREMLKSVTITKETAPYWDLLKVQVAIGEKNFRSASLMLEKLKTTFSRCPDTWLLAARLKEEQDKEAAKEIIGDALVEWETYVRQCQKNEKELRMAYEYIPNLCSSLAEAEKKIASH